jgi:hypothetical protein
MEGSNRYLNRGATCRYKITFPQTGNDYDELTLQINKLENATLYAVDTLRFDATEFVEYTPLAGETITTSYPY